MTQSPHPDPISTAQGDISLRQIVEGDRNQAIGQVYGGIVVYVSGGQAIINPAQGEGLPPAEISSPSGEITANPYKGLLSFHEADSANFFGRLQEIQTLWEEFRNLQTAAVRLLPIYGPSGSGKSSLARAGLIPELGRRPLPGRDKARVAVLVPGTQPLQALATVLARMATNDPIPVQKTREFAVELGIVTKAGEYDGLQRIVSALPEIGTVPLIVLVDQFEEVYSLCKDTQERDAFVASLLYAAADRSAYLSVILTMRSDLLGETQKHLSLNRLFSSQGFLVPMMDENGLREAIAQPAKQAGYPLDGAIVNLLIEQTEGREGALPLLQFALTRIWEGLKQGEAPAVTLEQIGGVGGALAGEAQRIYDSLESTDQPIARRVFLGLVQLGEGSKDTRRRTEIKEFVSQQTTLEHVKQVIARFADPGARLITLASNGDSVTAEVTHEALFDYWQELKTWLDSGRDDLRFQRRLEEAAKLWDELGRPEGRLWRPPDLDLLRQYQQRLGADMTPLQMEFFETSQATEEDWKRKAEQQQRFQKQAIRGLVTLSITALSLLGVASGLWVRAEFQKNQAETSEIRALVASSKALFTADKQFDALLAALKAGLRLKQNRSTSTNQSLQSDVYVALQQAVYGVQEQNRLEGHSESVYAVGFSPDDQTIASASWDKTVRLWSRQGKLLRILNGHTDDVMGVRFSPDGKMLASASRDKTVKLWNTNGLYLKTLTGHSEGVLGVAFSPDSKMIASSSYDKTIKLWKTDGKLIKTLMGNSDSVWSLSFSPDGKILASAGREGAIKLWNIVDGKLLKTLTKHKAHVRNVSFSQDGRTLISASDDGTVKLWSLTGNLLKNIEVSDSWVMSANLSSSGKTIVTGDVHGLIKLWSRDGTLIKTLVENEAVNNVAFSHDDKTIVSASSDKTIRLWSTSGSFLKSFDSKNDFLFDVSFSPDGKIVAASSYEGKVNLWNKNGVLLNTLVGHKDRVLSISFSPNSNLLASASWDGTIKLWDKKGYLIKTLTSSDKWLTIGQSIPAPINRVKFSPDGKVLASVGYGRKLRLWRTDGTPLRVIDNIVSGGPELSAVYGLDFSPDGKMLATAGWDRDVKVWSIDGKLLKILAGHSDRLFTLSFSPDGKTIASAGLDRVIKL